MTLMSSEAYKRTENLNSSPFASKTASSGLGPLRRLTPGREPSGGLQLYQVWTSIRQMRSFSHASQMNDFFRPGLWNW